MERGQQYASVNELWTLPSFMCKSTPDHRNQRATPHGEPPEGLLEDVPSTRIRAPQCGRPQLPTHREGRLSPRVSQFYLPLTPRSPPSAGELAVPRAFDSKLTAMEP